MHIHIGYSAGLYLFIDFVHIGLFAELSIDLFIDLSQDGAVNSNTYAVARIVYISIRTRAE